MRVRHFPIPRGPVQSNPWVAQYPNPADLPFNYYNLMSTAFANETGIGTAPSAGIRVAVVGGGVAGVAAARELVRAGYSVTIYEATARLCGRNFTFPGAGVSTGMELGAMRFPYFGEEQGQSAGSQNCLFDYYLTYEAGKAGNVAMTAGFPNPGAAPGGTGIYINQGHGPNDEFQQPTMISWPFPNDVPNDRYLAGVAKIVDGFINTFTGVVRPVYGTPEWLAMWQQIANRYDKMSFSDLVFAPQMSNPNDYQNDGWLGGFGMNDLQSDIFYTIGAGDGSWGAFYEVGAMWFIRCVMFGFNSNLQAVFGLSNAELAPNYNATFLDSGGALLPAPLFAGIQSLAEWLFYAPTPGLNDSLADQMNDSSGPNAPVQLYTNCGVTTIAKNGDGTIQVDDVQGNSRQFQYVIVTAPIWATDMSIDFQGFSTTDLPFATNVARAEQHIIASTKVFFPLKQTYWNVSKIPQILVTDTFVQDAYGIQWSSDDPGVLLASYTWEDDAVKLDPYSTNTQDPASPDNQELADMVLAELDRITTTTLGVAISQYVDNSNPVVWRWAAASGFNGCAKLYRQRNWAQNLALLAYNERKSAGSGLYFAGESYSVEGGWTEPALRLAIDAVIRLIQNSGGTFVPGFSPQNDYPSFPSFNVDEKYARPK